MTVWYARSTLHTRQSSIQSDNYQVSHRYSYFSWWWTHSCPKLVEKRNKHTKKNCAPSWLYLPKNKNVEVVCVSEIPAPGRKPFVTASKLYLLLECHMRFVLLQTQSIVFLHRCFILVVLHTLLLLWSLMDTWGSLYPIKGTLLSSEQEDSPVVKVKVNQSCYRPGVAQRVPGS